jgi:Zn finger protein HypA/HybF involved in hydrogenase expression
MLDVFDNVASVVTSIAIMICKFHEIDMRNINTNLHYTKKGTQIYEWNKHIALWHEPCQGWCPTFAKN